MRYFTYGKKENPAIVFLHGWGGTNESWGSIPKILAGFGFFSVVVDFPGFGNSEMPHSSFGVMEYALELKKLLETLEIEKITMIGHSFGGRVAIKYVSHNLSPVQKLVLVDSAGIKPRRGIKYHFQVWRFKRLKTLVELGRKPRELLDKFGSNDFRALNPVMKQVFVRVVNEDLEPDAKKIFVPTLLIWGGRDNSTPIFMAKKLNRAIKNSELKIFKTAGHFAYLERMDDFIDAVYEFVIT